MVVNPRLVLFVLAAFLLSSVFANGHWRTRRSLPGHTSASVPSTTPAGGGTSSSYNAEHGLLREEALQDFNEYRERFNRGAHGLDAPQGGPVSEVWGFSGTVSNMGAGGRWRGTGSR